MEVDAEGYPRNQSSIARTLDQDCLQELFSRCQASDLLPLRETCKLFNSLLSESHIVWARRMWEDYGIRFAILPSAPNVSFCSLAKHVYSARSDEPLRFQGVLVNGSVDQLNMWYWVDNIFRTDRSCFCSDSSANVDCLGMLLDGDVPRETQYNHVRRYMQRRCRYAAALFEQLHNPGELIVDQLMSLVEHWTDHRLEHFFQSLVENLHNDNPVGRLLLYDIPQDRMPLEQERLRAVSSFLRDRINVIKQGLVSLPGDLSTLFDASVLDKFGPEYPIRTVGIIRELEMSRAGNLTCPVLAGVVVAGIIDQTQLKGLSANEAATLLQKVTQDQSCIAFNGLDSLAAVQEQVSQGTLPPIQNVSKSYAGTVCEFDTSWEGSDFDPSWLRQSSSGPLVKWKPVAWFTFHTREEAERVVPQQSHEPAAEHAEPMEAGTPAPTPAPFEGEEALGMEVQQQQQPLVEQPAAGPSGLHNGAAGAAADDPWSEADFDDLAQGQQMIYGGPLPPPPGPPEPGNVQDQELNIPIEAANAANAVDQEVEEEEEEEEGGEDDIEIDDDVVDHTEGRNLLKLRLSRPLAANIMLVKLINQENLMEELMDVHPYPNVDMNFVAVVGKRIVLPPGVVVKPCP